MSQPNQSDEWLMGQVATGRRECLTPLVRRYASSLLTYIERMIGDRHRAEELFQAGLALPQSQRATFLHRTGR